MFTADVAATVDNEDALTAAVAVLVEAAAPGGTVRQRGRVEYN